MKNINRVRNNPRSKTSLPQAEIPPDFALPDGDVHPSCLCIYDRQTNTPVSKVTLSEKEFFDLLKKAKLGTPNPMSTGDFVAAAIRQKLSTDEVDCRDQVYNANSKAKTLLQLIADKFEHMAQLDGDAFSGLCATEFCVGLALLIQETKGSLSDAQKATENAFRPRTESAAQP